MVTVHLLDKHILRGQHIHAGLVGIVDHIPKLFDESVRVWEIYGVQGFIRPLLHTQEDDAAISIGKGRIGLPNALGQAAEGLLGLDAVVFPILLDFGKVDHGLPPDTCDPASTLYCSWI